jgi:hypothetical protein
VKLQQLNVKIYSLQTSTEQIQVHVRCYKRVRFHRFHCETTPSTPSTVGSTPQLEPEQSRHDGEGLPENRPRVAINA